MHPVIQAVVTAVVITAAVYDILYRRIPNWLVLPCWLLGFVLNAYLFGWEGLKSAGLGFGIAMLIFFPLWLLQGMAAGDVKLMAAIGALVGPLVWFWIFVFSGLVGGVIAIVLMAVHKRFRKTFSNLGFLLWDLVHLRAPYLRSEEMTVDSPRSFRLPHGAVFALGYLAFLGFALFSGASPF
jgi:prepilin peptidase CpaA